MNQQATFTNNSEPMCIVIPCNCGLHMLQVSNVVEYMGTDMFYQEIDLAMFSYGTENYRPNIFRRIRIAFNYLRTGKMFSDQVSMEPKEALRLSEFINKSIIKT